LNSEECLVRYETPEGQIAMSINSGSFEISEVVGIEAINSKVFPISHGNFSTIILICDKMFL